MTAESVVLPQDELKAATNEISVLRGQIALAKTAALASQAETLGSDAKLLVAELQGVDAGDLQGAAANLQKGLGDKAAVVLISPSDDGKVGRAMEGEGAGEGRARRVRVADPLVPQVGMVAAFGPEVVSSGLQAGKFIGGIARMCGGGGGGRPNLAQAGGKDPSKIPEALEAARAQLTEHLSAV